MQNQLINRILSSLILIPLVLFFVIRGSFLFNFFIFICFLITIYEWHMMSKKQSHYFPGFIFLILSFASVFALRNSSLDETLFNFLFILFICVFTDIGGYIFGNLFKGPKLTKISPKKTYSGVIGGYFFSIIFISLYIEYSYLLNLELSNQSFNLQIFILLLLISTISQIGDIVISYFKRVSNIKDTGKIIPGHGGLLDRIDGMIFAFPFFYLIKFFSYIY